MIFPSGTTPLDIHECVEGVSDLGNSGSVEQTLQLRGCSGVWYFERNYGAGSINLRSRVMGPPYDPTTYLNS